MVHRNARLLVREDHSPTTSGKSVAEFNLDVLLFLFVTSWWVGGWSGVEGGGLKSLVLA